jgi:hypothetical protein
MSPQSAFALASPGQYQGQRDPATSLSSAQARALARSGKVRVAVRKQVCALTTQKLFFCIPLVMEACAARQPPLALRVRWESELGSVDVLACRAR